MKHSRGKPHPWPTWVGAALGILVLTSAPPRIQARPYNPEYGPVPDGDPTADDQPSPTPKGGGGHYATYRPDADLTARKPGATMTASQLRGRLIWLSFVRTWIWIGMR
ncbi:MAG TPA: hypothetical protein VFX78_08305 [Candidatus Eisenbacteria bacterium]|jgi:hypothetical protein|nr:hypothetical protein [Candidatus Eisenbacteria bacterium]